MSYSSDLTNGQWLLIKEFFVINRGKNLQHHEKRELVNSVLYGIKTGFQWRLIFNHFPSHDTVWPFYRRAIQKGIWEKAMDEIVAKVCYLNKLSTIVKKHAIVWEF